MTEDTATAAPSVAAAQAAVDALMAELDALRAERKELESRQSAVTDRIRSIVGGFGSGDLALAKWNLECARQWEADASLLAVAWLVPQSTACDGEKQYVVDKVTDKRIYVRKRGEPKTTVSGEPRTMVDAYDRVTGNPVRKWRTARIDVEKTLGGPAVTDGVK